MPFIFFLSFYFSCGDKKRWNYTKQFVCCCVQVEPIGRYAPQNVRIIRLADIYIYIYYFWAGENTLWQCILLHMWCVHVDVVGLRCADDDRPPCRHWRRPHYGQIVWHCCVCALPLCSLSVFLLSYPFSIVASEFSYRWYRCMCPAACRANSFPLQFMAFGESFFGRICFQYQFLLGDHLHREAFVSVWMMAAAATHALH